MFLLVGGRISQADAGGSTGACVVGRAGTVIDSRWAGAGGSGVGIFVMRTCVPLWVGFGFLVLCGAGVFAKAGGILGFVTMRWGIC